MAIKKSLDFINSNQEVNILEKVDSLLDNVQSDKDEHLSSTPINENEENNGHVIVTSQQEKTRAQLLKKLSVDLSNNLKL